MNPLRFALFETKVQSVEMIIDLVKLGNTVRDFEYDAAPESVNLDDDGARLLGPAHVKATVRPHSVQTRIDGTIGADVELECSRCLAKVERPLSIEFSDSFVTKDYASGEKETELTSNDLDVAVFDGDRIDLDELVREQILLGLPEQVFCREDCQGFCQRCGANLNDRDCGCEDEEIDPRWAGLKNLK